MAETKRTSWRAVCKCGCNEFQNWVSDEGDVWPVCVACDTVWITGKQPPFVFHPMLKESVKFDFLQRKRVN